MFNHGAELERFRAFKIASVIWGSNEGSEISDKPDLDAKNKVYGPGRVITR